MAGGLSLVWIAAALGAGGLVALRFAWALPRRSPAWTGAGWALIGLSVVVAGQAEGAWGVALSASITMAAALIAIGVAGLGAPAGRTAASNRSVAKAEEARHIGRRVVTFALVILAGFAASVGLALGARGLGQILGWSAADSNALALFTTPLAWALLCVILLMQTRRRSQVATLLICSLPALPVLVTGFIA